MHARNFGSMPMYRAWHRASLITWKMASRSSLTWREWQRTSTNQRLLDSLQTVEQAGAQVDLHDRGDQCEVLFWRTSWTEEECASQCCSHWQSRCRSKAAQPCTLHRSCAKVASFGRSMDQLLICLLRSMDRSGTSHSDVDTITAIRQLTSAYSLCREAVGVFSREACIPEIFRSISWGILHNIQCVCFYMKKNK